MESAPLSVHHPLGIFASVLGPQPLAALAAAVAANGFSCVHLDPHLPGLPAPGGGIEAARQVRRVFAEHGVTIAALAGYKNLVDPDLQRREAALRDLERLIDLCPEYGTTLIATETGSVNRESPWEDTPDNHTPATWHELLEVLARLLRRARAAGVSLLIEGYVNNVVATTEEARRLIDACGGQSLGFVLDPFNYFTREDMAQPQKALERVFDALADRAGIAHAKDVVYGERGIETPMAGAGAADWPAYARLLRQRLPQVPLILEHLGPADVPACKAFVEAAFASAARTGA